MNQPIGNCVVENSENFVELIAILAYRDGSWKELKDMDLKMAAILRYIPRRLRETKTFSSLWYFDGV